VDFIAPELAAAMLAMLMWHLCGSLSRIATCDAFMIQKAWALSIADRIVL